MCWHYIQQQELSTFLLFRCSSSDLSLASETDSSWRVGHQPPSSAIALWVCVEYTRVHSECTACPAHAYTDANETNARLGSRIRAQTKAELLRMRKRIYLSSAHAQALVPAHAQSFPRELIRSIA